VAESAPYWRLPDKIKRLPQSRRFRPTAARTGLQR